jgi:hypothetical protein
MNLLRRLVQEQTGSVLVYALMGITLLSTLLFTVFIMSSHAMTNALHNQMNAQSRYTAEAGLEKAIRHLLDQPNKIQSLNIALSVNNGAWILEEQISLTEVGYATSYEVTVKSIVPDKIYEFISVARTIGDREMEFVLKKRISFAYQPFSYASSPLFDYSLYSQSSSLGNGTFTISGGSAFVGGSMQTNGSLTLQNLTLCAKQGLQHRGRLNETDVLYECPAEELDSFNEMSTLYESFVAAGQTREDIYVSDTDVVIDSKDVVNGKWKVGNSYYNVIIAPNIKVGIEVELGSAASPVLLLAGTEDNELFEPGVINVTNSTIYGFLAGESVGYTTGAGGSLVVNGGIVSLQTIGFGVKTDIIYPMDTGTTFSETYN